MATHEEEGTPVKKRRLSVQHFRSEYTNAYADILRSSKGSIYARCVTCGCDFSISHGGENDIKKHLKTTKHIQGKSAGQCSRKMDSFFVKTESTQEYSVVNAECLFTSLIVEHNIPLSVSDHASKIFHKMFPDSEIAKKYSCARTKTTAIIGEMATSATEKNVRTLESKMFNLSTDGSNDVDSKLYPIVISYFDDDEERVVTTLLSNPNLVGKSTGENIAELLKGEFSSKNLKWENVISLGVDNANVMTGKKKGLYGQLLQINSKIILRGCPCHLLHLAAEKAAKQLHYQFDEILIDIYYYLEKSANRKQDLQEFQNLCDVESHSILKHVCTRWLSLGKCLGRLIEQWRPLKHYFTEKHEEKKRVELEKQRKVKTNTTSVRKSEIEKPDVVRKHSVIRYASSSGLICKSSDKKDDVSEKQKCEGTTKPKDTKSGERSGIKKCAVAKKTATKKTDSHTQNFKSPDNTYLREERLYKLLTSRRCVVYALFLNNCIEVFDRYNILLQKEEPLIHRLQRILLGLYKEILCRFIKPQAITSKSDILDIDYKDKSNIHENELLFIGHEIKPFLAKLAKEDKHAFYADVTKYYQASLDYMNLKFPLKDEILKHAEVADVARRESGSIASLEVFAEKVKPIIADEDAWLGTMNDIHRQFLNYQTDPLTGIDLSQPINKVWCDIGKMKDEFGLLMYEDLCTVMKSILVIPHSNAGCERIFSLVRKNRTDFRGSMSNDTLEALLVCKQEMTSTPCHQQQFDQKFLKRAKSATYKSLQNH